MLLTLKFDAAIEFYIFPSRRRPEYAFFEQIRRLVQLVPVPSAGQLEYALAKNYSRGSAFNEDIFGEDCLISDEEGQFIYPLVCLSKCRIDTSQHSLNKTY
ncbi:unnamed protein product [Dibothriocephalus latus]|uniref:Uncharacterized protein n=1 Tax=Dibothriocephalus latus TaxID=60516 RepID=A0A3P6PV82_DIBLA|nr:unnamed protein product [Dibothriocephalus latus]